MYVNIAILKETTSGEHHVALILGVVPSPTKLGGRLHMESGVAEGIGLADADFVDVVVIADRAVLVADADVVLCFQPPALAVIDSQP
jgi:NAD(P) transhydrogenase subunit alpha